MSAVSTSDDIRNKSQENNTFWIPVCLTSSTTILSFYFLSTSSLLLSLPSISLFTFCPPALTPCFFHVKIFAQHLKMQEKTSRHNFVLTIMDITVLVVSISMESWVVHFEVKYRNIVSMQQSTACSSSD